MNLAVNPDCKVKDEKYAVDEKAKLSLTFTKGKDGKFSTASAEQFYKAFNKLYLNLKNLDCYKTATKDGVSQVNFALQSTAGSRKDLVNAVNSADNFVTYY